MFEQIHEGVALKPSVFQNRFEKNVQYLLSLTTENLVRNYLLEAGLWSYSGNSSTTIDLDEFVEDPSSWHWGWESVTSEIRGHFLGHWLSAAAKTYEGTKDPFILGKIQVIIQELEVCQSMNGNGWLASIPEKYMSKMEKGQSIWAPHYTIHKTMMGLWDTYLYTNNTDALDILINFSKWFVQWCQSVSEEVFGEILAYETGGMLEIWANLYDITKDENYLMLIDLYYREVFFDKLLADADVLTNKHANTQIAEILGIARAWEVTKKEKYKEIVEKFWEKSVEVKGTYVTGGVSCGELWTPDQDLTQRLGKAQEHCTVYHMMRLARFLFKWTGDSKYGDFEEKCLYNGILAQQNQRTGMVTYFLDMEPGAKKNWGDPTKHFWCCHGTLVQAQSSYHEMIFYQNEDQLIINQYIPAELKYQMGREIISVSIQQDSQRGSGPLEKSNSIGKKYIQTYNLTDLPYERPHKYVYSIQINTENSSPFILKLRNPEWSIKTKVSIDGKEVCINEERNFIVLNEKWHGQVVTVEFYKRLEAVQLLGSKSRMALMDGPLVLAGISDEDFTLNVELDESITDIFIPDNERHHSFWRDGCYRTTGQENNITFMPIAEITNQPYTIYFDTTEENHAKIRGTE